MFIYFYMLLFGMVNYFASSYSREGLIMVFCQDHEIIEMLWEILKSFSTDNQKKFLKYVALLFRGMSLSFCRS
jgi:hypothetical protein